MSRITAILSATVVAAVALVSPESLKAQTGAAGRSSADNSQRIAACALLPKDEVKRYLPWLAVLDQMPIEEEPVGASGSSCNYPSVFIQVLPFSPRTIEMARQKGGLATVAGVGDEAYFYNNADRYAELYVRIGKHLLTVQANANETVEAVRPGVVSLAKALIVKLR